MSKIISLICVLTVGGIAASGCRQHLGAGNERPLRVGMSEVDITPPVGHRMAGYYDERASTGVHDRLWARAIVLEQGRERVAMVFCDLLGVSLSISTNARAQASRLTGIPASHILIAATHSHTGPLFDDVRRDYFHQTSVKELGHDPRESLYYPDYLAERIAVAVKQAYGMCAPGVLRAGVAEQTGLSFNRRYHMKNGQVRFNPGQLNPEIVRPAGPIDPEAGWLLVHGRGSEQPLGGLVIFACHCDTAGGTEYSADFPYYLGQTLKGGFGEHFIPAFAAGTCGDINHINVSVKENVKGFALSERIGTTLGSTVLAAMKQGAGEGNGVVRRPRPTLEIGRPSLAMRSRTILAPLQEVTEEQLAKAKQLLPLIGSDRVPFMEKVEAVKAIDLRKRGAIWPMEVQVIRIDEETALVGLPGEIFVELGLEIKRRSPFRTTMVMSICNDRPGYVPTRKAFAEGSYEVVNSRVKPGVGEMLVEEALNLLAELKPRR
jgi:neutral ceramidase